MNEPRNNSLLSIIIFLCLATFVILAIVIGTEESIPTPTPPIHTLDQSQQ